MSWKPETKAGPDGGSDSPTTAAEIKRRAQSLSRDQLLGLLDDKELFASLDQFLQGDLLTRLAHLDPQVAVQRALDGTIPENAFKGIRLNPNFFVNHKEFASGLLKTLDPADPLQGLVLSKVYMAGLEGAPAVVAESLLIRSKGNPTLQMPSGYRTALMHLYSSNPAQAVSVVTANTEEGSRERLSSFFFIGQEIPKKPGSEITLGLDSIPNKDLEALTAGKTAGLLRSGNANGLDLLKTLPNEGLVRVISQQPSFAGLCKIDPQAAVDLISRIEMPTEGTGAMEEAAYTLVRLNNKDMVSDWISQQPDSEKRAAVLKGSIKRLEEISAPDLDDWKKQLAGATSSNAEHE